MDRRTFAKKFLATTSLPLFKSGRKDLSSRSLPGSRASARAVAVASGNGLEAVRHAYQALLAGADPVDAAVGGVSLAELDPREYSVGYGGLPNYDGVVQLDAAVMHGPTGKAGAVAALEGVKTPSQVARLVMQRTEHVLLVGKGASRFAATHGFPQEELLTDFSRKVWLYWKENLSEKDNWIEPPLTAIDPEVREFFRKFPYLLRAGSTIHLSALSPSGDLGCCTSTSGTFFKLPGRVGDSPIIGAGLYAENEVGSAGATGRGEAAILTNASRTSVDFMRQGLAPTEALLKTLEWVVRQNRNPRLRRADGRPTFNLRLYAVNKAGAYGSAAIFKGQEFKDSKPEVDPVAAAIGGKFAVADEKGARLEDSAFLFKG